MGATTPMHTGLAISLTAAFAMTAGVAMWQAPPAPTTAMATAARAFLDALPARQREQAQVPLADASRTQWGFVPATYPGVPLGELDLAGARAAHALLRTALSTQGYLKATSIVQLEEVLRAIEGPQATHRDPGRYWLQVFGEPAPTGTWAWRVQGHHLSLHFACSGGALVGHTPSFYGANPHEVRTGPRAGTRVLGAAEDLARDLLQSLTPAQRAHVQLPGDVPADVILGPGRAADFLGEPKGIAWRELAPEQQQRLWALVVEFAQDLKGEFATAELARIDAQGRPELHFAWAGGAERGQGHYWRVQGKDFAIEYDNTQNDANHVHTVWRDLAHDFGGDPLRAHVEHDHAPGHEHGRDRDGDHDH